MIILFISTTPLKAYAVEELATTWGTLSTASSTMLLKIDYGTEAGEVLYYQGADGAYEAGPEAFYVENENSIYILDTLNKRIIHYVNGIYLEEILIESVVAPQSFRIDAGGTLYVCDTYNGESTLRVYYTNGTEKAFLLEDMNYINVRNIGVVSENMIALSDWYDIYLYEINGEEANLLKKTALESIEASDVTYSKYIGGDADCHYEMQTTLVECSMLIGEINIVAYNNNGKSLGSARVPLEDFVFRPNQYVQIGTGGNIYLMIPTETGLQIRKVTLGMISDSKLDEVEAFAEQYESEMTQEASVASAFVTLTRQEVLTRANTIVNQSWTLSSENVNTTGYSDVKIPDYIRPYITSGALINGGTVTLTGIPYCWGGYDSCYTSGNSGCSTFNDAIANGYLAGNVATSADGHVDETAGLDCSGFVSAAYGISKIGTSSFSSQGTSVTKDELETMDYLVRYNYVNSAGKPTGNHVVLFYNWQAEDKSRMLIMEVAIRESTEDRTLIMIKDTDFFMNNGYRMRTPWQINNGGGI